MVQSTSPTPLVGKVSEATPLAGVDLTKNAKDFQSENLIGATSSHTVNSGATYWFTGLSGAGKSTLSSALSSEARGDADAAVAKTAAIKNIQKALTARILKRLDDGQPLVEVARKMKAIEGMQP